MSEENANCPDIRKERMIKKSDGNTHVEEKTNPRCEYG